MCSFTQKAVKSCIHGRMIAGVDSFLLRRTESSADCRIVLYGSLSGTLSPANPVA